MRDHSVGQFLRDASLFVASSRGAIELSAPHIYLSAIPFADQKSLIYQDFYERCTGLIAVDTYGICHHSDRAVMSFTGHTGAVLSIAYSSHLLASGSADGTVRVWNTHTGEEVMAPLHSDNGAVMSVDFARNGKWIASGTEAWMVCIWDVAAHHASNRPLSGHSGPVSCVVFSRDSSRLASASYDKTVCLWDPTSGQQVIVFRQHAEWVNRLAFSPNGQILAAVSEDETIGLWKSITGQAVREPFKLSGASDVAFSPDGNMIAAAFDDGVILWQSQSREIITRLHTDTKTHSVQFSPDGQKLVAACGQGTRLWTLQPEPTRATWADLGGHSGKVYSAVFSQDRLCFASASDDGTIRIWSSESGEAAIQPLPAHASSINSVAISRDGSFIVSGSDDKSVRVWDAHTGQPRFSPLCEHNDRVNSVAISPDGRLIASASGDGTVRLWQACSGAAIGVVKTGDTRHVMAVTFARDGCWMAATYDNIVHIWEVVAQSGSPVSRVLARIGSPSIESTVNSHDVTPRCCHPIDAVAFSHRQGNLAAGDLCGRICLWQAKNGQQGQERLHAKGVRIRSLASSPSDTSFVSGGDDCAARIWADGDKPLHTLPGHIDIVQSVDWSDGGKLIATGSFDGDLRLWNANTGQLQAILRGYQYGVSSVAFTSDGQSIISGSYDCAIRKWDVSKACTLYAGAMNKCVGPEDRPSASTRDADPIATLALATLEDGWLKGSSGELLLWIPTEYHGYLQLNPCTMQITQSRVVVRVGEGHLHTDSNWAACWRTGTT